MILCFKEAEGVGEWGEGLHSPLLCENHLCFSDENWHICNRSNTSLINQILHSSCQEVTGVPENDTLWLKVVSANFLLVYFEFIKESTCGTRKMVFFHFESSFHSWYNQVLNFRIFECDDVIKCQRMKHETHFIE